MVDFWSGSKIYNSFGIVLLPSRSEGRQWHGQREERTPPSGAPPLSGVQLTPAERAKLDARAAHYGLRLSEYVRLLLLSDERQPLPSARDSAAIRALAVEITRVGTNINQLAHIANERRELPRKAELDAVSAQIVATLEKVMEL